MKKKASGGPRLENSTPSAEKRTPLEDLLWGMGNTARSRFAASKRLESLDRRLTQLTAITSSYLIVLTVLPYFLHLKTQVEDHINLISVALTIVILASSLLQYSSASAVKSEQFHRSALEINELKKSLQVLGGAITHKDLSHSRFQYSSILQKYSINHDPMDFQAVQLERPQDFPWLSKGELKAIRRKIAFSTGLPIFRLITITLLWLAVIFIYALPNQIVA